MTRSRSEGALPCGFWNIQDLSAYLNIKVKTLYSMLHDIPHYRVGRLIRFKKEEIDAWMENNRAGDKVGSYVEAVVKKAIDRTRGTGYNRSHGKSDLIKGPTKETYHGSI